MVELRILGSPGLQSGDGHTVSSVLQQPKRLALLSYLAVTSSGKYVRRDKVLALFWPHSPERKARSSLSEALSRLRSSLGTGVVATRGTDEVGLQGVWCDAVELLRAEASEDWETVARLYRGPFLDGLPVDGLQNLESWIEQTRSRMSRIAVDALGRLADRAIERGDDGAITWAERALQVEPLDVGAVRRLMWELARSGHDAAALDAFDQYAARLSASRDMAPPSELKELAGAIRSGSLARTTNAAIAQRPVSPPPVAVHAPRLRDRTPLATGRVLAAAAILTALVLGVGVTRVLRRDVPPVVLRYALSLPEGEGLSDQVLRPRIALSPEGSRLLYVGESDDGTPQLWLRNRAELHATPLPGTPSATNPFFSPDGRRYGYLRGPSPVQAVMIGAFTGEAPSVLVEGGVGLAGASWGEDEFVYYDGLTAGGTTGVVRVPVAGGQTEHVTRVDTAGGEIDHVWPSVLPDARGVLFTILRREGTDAADVAVHDLRTGRTRVLLRAISAQYVSSGHLLFLRTSGTLGAVPFDLERLQARGEAVELADGVSWRLNGAADIALSASGTLAYVQGAQTPEPGQIVWIDRDGEIEPVENGWASDFGTLALSPDGSRLAFSTLPATWFHVQDLYLKELPWGALSRLTTVGPAQNFRPSWSPDGRWVTFLSDRAGQLDVYERRADGTGSARILLDGERAITDAVLSPDGEWLVYVEGDDIFGLREGRSLPLVRSSAVESLPVVSPDGRWLAYTSDESGREEVYVSALPDPAQARYAVSIGGGFAPLWAPGGEEIFYKTAEGAVVSRPVLPGDDFELGPATSLFTLDNPWRWTRGRNYAISPDGTRILTIITDPTGGVAELVVNEGMPALLDRLVGR